MISQHYVKNSLPSEEDCEPDQKVPASRGMSGFSNNWFLLIAVGLGIIEAFFIVSGYWPVAVVLALLAPAIVILIKYPFAVFIFWLLVIPFLQNTNSTQSRTAFWVLYRALPMLAVCLALLTNRLQPENKRLRLKFGPDGLAMLVFLGWVFVNIFWYHPSGNQAYIYTLYDQSFVPFCLYWWIRLTSPAEQDLKRLLPVAFFLVIFEVGIGILSWLMPGILPADWVGTTSERTIGTMSFVHAYTLTLIFFSLLLFHTALNRKPKGTSLTLLLAVGIGMAGVFLGFSRGPWLAGIIICVGLLFLYPKPVLRLIVTMIIIMTILGSTMLSEQIAFADQRLNSEQTAKVRLVIWDAGLQMIKLKPLFGWGYGDYKLYAGQFQRIIFGTEATEQHASHNTFISFAAELGLPGLLLYLFPAFWWFILSFKRRELLPQTGFWSQKLLIIFWLFLLAYSIIIFFSDIRTSPYGLCLWWVALGWIATMIDPSRAHNQSMSIQSLID